MSCDCIYEFLGIARETLEETHPKVFHGGPTEAMYAQWDITWRSRRIPWSGEMNGLAECREFGFWASWDAQSGWTRVPAMCPGAQEDQDRLFRECIWDAGKRRWERRLARFSGATLPRAESAKIPDGVFYTQYTIVCCGPFKPAVLVLGAADSDARCLSHSTISLCWNDVSSREKAAASIASSGWQRIDTWRWVCPDCAEAASPPG